ncbi:hypothetical protein G7K_1728-t1 [Saitoella complicata NRRL Y-17804]|uniref:Uncharacterized protein n=1 Tax=Saitoella complicata (strain BCRC 22490 / CBS 7301 / JCM 7358 / NBRC 10748 / NRRL Y-17804) TaxID=698492 RepID=A0A0E9NCJ6_SAICN|nr:hypothetical protein G7K_1728-t1 [Saitoella complicata NRRL Y-17804]
MSTFSNDADSTLDVDVEAADENGPNAKRRLLTAAILKCLSVRFRGSMGSNQTAKLHKTRRRIFTKITQKEQKG